MTTDLARNAYKSFAAARNAWWALPPAQRAQTPMPQPADFDGTEPEIAPAPKVKPAPVPVPAAPAKPAVPAPLSQKPATNTKS